MTLGFIPPVVMIHLYILRGHFERDQDSIQVGDGETITISIATHLDSTIHADQFILDMVGMETVTEIDHGAIHLEIITTTITTTTPIMVAMHTVQQGQDLPTTMGIELMAQRETDNMGLDIVRRA